MIRYLVMDVDGSLTDGKIYMGPDGEAMKAFSIKDGYAINSILKFKGIVPVIITGRSSSIVQKRCEELGIKEVYQGKKDKLAVLKEIVGESMLGSCAYFGDDIIDLQCMTVIREAGGTVGCPADAVREIKAVAEYVCISKAGEGALREFAEWLVLEMESESEAMMNDKVNWAIAYLETMDKEHLQPGKYVVNENFYYMVQEYRTKKAEQCRLESHRKYVDIQWILYGEEVIETTSIAGLQPEETYNEETDVMFWRKPVTNMARSVLRRDSYVVLYPRDAHMPCIAVTEPVSIKRIVGKVRIIN